jgi:hypothetical protein
VSFGAGVTGCTARISGLHAGPATVVLRAADPVDGPVIATLTAEVEADRYAWRTASSATAPVRGPVNVYAVPGAPGVCLRELAFVTG